MLQDEIIENIPEMIIPSQASAPTADWSVWSLCAAGDYLMIPILLLLLIALYVFCERAYFIVRAGKNNEMLMRRIKDYVHENEIESADNLCRADDSPASAVLRVGLQYLGHPLEFIRGSMLLRAEIETYRLSALTRWLPFIGAAAPMAGLLGALCGVVRTVFDNPELDANSPVLYTPVITIIVGLITGLAAIAAHYYISSRMNRVRMVLDSTIERFLAILNEPSA